MPELIYPYNNLSRENNAIGSIDLGLNWTGATSYLITGLPAGAAQTGDTGVVTYTFTGTVERSLVTVTAIDGSNMVQASFNWNVYSADAVNNETQGDTLQDIVAKLGG